ncbi:MAG: DUF1365 domain-containing protein [Chthoniobacterales bacterium]|nr:DUF1365 domain-containing protein [Chthoniobacterales bacterium]
MNSCFYECDVFHRRLRPKQHEFLYRVFYFYLDLGELDEAARKLKIFGTNRPDIYSLWDKDHFQYGERVRPISDNVREFLERSGCPLEPAGSIRMLCFPRMFGYVFNPVTLYFCFNADGTPETCVVEVGNTFRELKPYLVPRSAEGKCDFEVRVPKEYYVSPFSPVDLEFHFRLHLPDERLRIFIDDYDAEGKVLVSTLTGKRRELTFGNLAKFTAKFPFITLKVITLIHWQAFRLWLKRVPFFWKESRAGDQRDVFRPHKSLSKRP